MKKQKGQAALSTILLIGGIIVLIGIALVVMISAYGSSIYAFYNAEKALAIANAGADDGLMRVVRDKTFENLSGYNIAIENYQANVMVDRDSPLSGQTTIISTANVLGYVKKVKIVVSIDEYGEVRIIKREQI